MKIWEQYCEDVETGKIRTGNTIKQAVARFRDFLSREDLYFDEECVDNCIEFISHIKHFLGKSAGKPFILEPWQCFIVAHLGIKRKDTGYRLINEFYIQIARKAGKDALMAAIALYLMIAEGESAPEIICAANSTEQSRILFEYITKFAHGLDPTDKTLVPYRNYIKMPINSGKVTVISSDASKADGRNCFGFFIDEFHEAKDRKMYDVLKSSQGMRTQPLGFIITTAGFNLDGPCHDMYELAIQVLAGIKELDNFCPLIWELDEDDDYTDPDNFIKCQPNLGVTVTKEFMIEEVKKAEADATAISGVLTKTFNKWVQSKVTWIPQERIAKLMKPVDLKDYAGEMCVIGTDLSTVNDLSSISVMFPESGMHPYVYKSYTFLPEKTIREHPNRALYQKFVEEGSMIMTPGNCIDYDFILSKIGEINSICPVSAIYVDTWNATQFQITATEAGYNVIPFSQAIGNYNACTKEFERQSLEGNMVIDKSTNTLWQVGNVFLKSDVSGNCKPSKESYGNKIDTIISMTTALGGWMKNPGKNDVQIYVL